MLCVEKLEVYAGDIIQCFVGKMFNTFPILDLSIDLISAIVGLYFVIHFLLDDSLEKVIFFKFLNKKTLWSKIIFLGRLETALMVAIW